MTGSPKAKWIFDQDHYVKHIEARGALIRTLVPRLRDTVGLTTALDAGCGPGFFAQILRESKLTVVGFDGRAGNTEEARRRYPDILFETRDVEDSSVLQMGVFDLLICFGLLYHLESPLRAIRHLRSLTGKILLLESMCLPSKDPCVLLREEPNSDDQSLTDLAFYPSEEAIIKMLYRAGFSWVYRVEPLPEHDDFWDTPEHTRRRTVLLAAFQPVKLAGLVPLSEVSASGDPWAKTRPAGKVAPRVKRFIKRPWSEKFVSLSYRWYLLREFWARFMKRVSIPTLLPFGALWVAKNDHVGQPIREGRFEVAEVRFVESFVKAGMTVLDIGAHHGFYTLLCSKRVGAKGRVVAFEPSPRERKALQVHLKLNRCRNVRVEALALGNENTTGNLYVIEGRNTGCNSLKPPTAVGDISPVSVRVARLDEWLRQCKLDRVDFIKLDVEGGELPLLEGAAELLERRPRPVILAEVQDVRTQPWGYRAKEIIDHLARRGYKWFTPLADGSMELLDVTANEFEGNFVAFPEEFGIVLDTSKPVSDSRRPAEGNVRDFQANTK